LNFIYVFLGGGLGAMARYGISKITSSPENGFPLATFITNVLSCILLGLLIGYLAQKPHQVRTQLLFATGFCGGFSTFSTFSAETFELIQSGQNGIALSYVLLSITISLIAVYVGLKLANFL